MEIFSVLLPNWHWSYLLFIPGLIIGFTAHELAHSLMAYFLGDTSQVKTGSITMNPFKHIAWFGGTLFILFGLGWPKTLHFEPDNFKNRYLDSLLTALVGPAASFAVSLIVFVLSAVGLTLVARTLQLDNEQVTNILFFNRNNELGQMSANEAFQSLSVWIVAFTNRVYIASFILAIISLIPLPPFDGFVVLLSLTGLMKERRISHLTDIPATAPENNSQIIEPKTNNKSRQTVADIHFKLGADYHQKQQFDDAIARYRQAIQADESYGPAYVNLGLVYKAKNQRPEAIHALRGATRYATDDKSKAQAWAELHALSALPGAPPDLAVNNEDTGVVPWTDTQPSPDWVMFWTGAVLFLLFFGCLLGILLTNMMNNTW